MIIGNPITLGGGGGAKGQPLSSLTEGSLVSVLEGGKLVPFYVAKHHYEHDLNGAGRTLLVRKDGYDTRVWHKSNVNAYASSDISTWLDSDYKELLSGAVQSNIGLTTFEYTVGNGESTKSTLTRGVFLLSAYELGLTSSTCNNEGEPLPIASALSVLRYNDTAVNQWTRTPQTGNTTAAIMVSSSGAIIAASPSSTGYYSRPCFTLPATMTLRTEPYADGSWGLADETVLEDTETATAYAKSGVTYTSGISDLDADTLNTIAAAISSNPNIDKYIGTIYYDKGDAHRRISTGDTLDIFIGDATYTFRVIGFNHDYLAVGNAYSAPTASGKAGMTLEMVTCLPSQWQMNTSATNVGGWGSCFMRSNYVPYIEERLPGGIATVLKAVEKSTSAGNKSSTINITDDTLFLLSEIEVFNTTTRSVAGEGSQYAYYKAGNSKIKKRGGSANNWWLRSPHYNNTNGFCCVLNTGDGSGLTANDSSGASFAFCI